MTIEYQGEMWTIGRWVSGFYNNAYLVTCNSTNKSVIIDTPDEPLEMIAAAEATDVQAILITHNHWDHIEGFDVVTGKFAVPVGIGENDAAAISDREGYRGPIDVSQDSILQVGEITIRCIETPGHTPGSTCFVLARRQSRQLVRTCLSGDTLFPGGTWQDRQLRRIRPDRRQRIQPSIETAGRIRRYARPRRFYDDR